jgi:hypothetical protein
MARSIGSAVHGAATSRDRRRNGPRDLRSTPDPATVVLGGREGHVGHETYCPRCRGAVVDGRPGSSPTPSACADTYGFVRGRRAIDLPLYEPKRDPRSLCGTMAPPARKDGCGEVWGFRLVPRRALDGSCFSNCSAGALVWVGMRPLPEPACVWRLMGRELRYGSHPVGASRRFRRPPCREPPAGSAHRV